MMCGWDGLASERESTAFYDIQRYRASILTPVLQKQLATVNSLQKNEK